MDFESYLLESSQALKDCVTIIDEIKVVENLLWNSHQAGNKILWCGNGGSASDSQHLAAELVGRFARNRKPISSIALTTDTSILTSVGNDFGFENIFKRQIEAIGRNGDVLIGLSTSGESKNVINAVNAANSMGILTVALTGKNMSALSNVANHIIFAPSSVTSHIQECHIAIGQAICGALEERIS